MRSHAIVLATPGNLETAWSRWAEPVRGAWPCAERPRMTWTQVDEFLSSLEGRPGQEREPLPAAALIALGTLDHAWTVDRLIEAMMARSIPGIFLLPNPQEWRQFQRHGVIFERHDTDPKVLAAMLYALAERQSAVDLLQRELYVTQRTQGGFRAEMDRMHDELHMAASVQREFIPSALPKVEGLDLAVVFRPVNYVSGDIYNVEQLDERTIGFFIADAVGHGVPAALLTMVLSHSLATTEACDVGRRPIAPSRVLGVLNDRLCAARSINGRFATAVYGMYDVVDRMVTLAGAGHPPPIVLSRGRSRAVETEGPLLGVFPDATFPEVTFRLDHGDTLLLLTDGVEAAFNGTRDGLASRSDSGRYVDRVSRLFSGEGSTVRDGIDELHALLDEQSGSLHQADDVTALVLRPVAVAAQSPVVRAAA